MAKVRKEVPNDKGGIDVVETEVVETDEAYYVAPAGGSLHGDVRGFSSAPTDVPLHREVQGGASQSKPAASTKLEASTKTVWNKDMHRFEEVDVATGKRAGLTTTVSHVTTHGRMGQMVFENGTLVEVL